MNNPALVLSSQSNYEEAERIHRQELALTERVLGKEHPDPLTSMNNLALAEQIHRQSVSTKGKGTGQGVS